MKARVEASLFWRSKGDRPGFGHGKSSAFADWNLYPAAVRERVWLGSGEK